MKLRTIVCAILLAFNADRSVGGCLPRKDRFPRDPCDFEKALDQARLGLNKKDPAQTPRRPAPGRGRSLEANAVYSH
jgi:hypothetical protein